MRVLVIAELANPFWESVPLVGWSHWRALSKLVDGHLVTHPRNGENILAAGEDPARFTTIDTDVVQKPVLRVERFLRGGDHRAGGLTTATALNTISYYYFEHELWRRFGEGIRARKWDLVHRLTPLSPVTPSILASKCAAHGVPFVLGPINGGLPWPKGFTDALRAEREWLSYVREAYKLLPGYRGTRRHASAIITGSRHTREQIAQPYRDKTVYIPENAIDTTRFSLRKSGPVTLPLKVAFVGRFVKWKGLDMLLEAAAPLVRAGRVALDIIGDGLQAPAIRALAEREGLPQSIFAGWIKNDKLQERLVASDVLGFPSIREFGGGVVLESMALGLVPIVVDYGGPAELVTPETGIKLPLGTRAQITASLRDALTRLADDPSRIRAMGDSARARVMKHFTWEAKAVQTLEVYRWATGQREKPEFPMPVPD